MRVGILGNINLVYPQVGSGSVELEPMCILWVKVGFISGTWTHAFKLLRR